MSELIFTEEGIRGDHPGRLRIVATEESGESQLGLLWGIRSRHYDDADTAQLAYEAEAMTPLDTAATAVLTGASGSGSNTVRHANLATSWTPVLSTQAVSAGAHKTHKGTYRVWARVYSTSGDDVQLRLVWDVGDLALPVENAPERLPQTASQFYLVDLGEVRLDQIPQGDHRWQGVIQAKGDAGGENVSIDKVYIVPVDEGYGVLRAPVTADPSQVTYSARDEFNQSAGALTGKTLPVGGTWAAIGGSDADDFSLDTTAHTAIRTAVSDTAEAGRLLSAGTTTYTALAIQVDVSQTTFYAWQGLFARLVDISNYLRVHIYPTGNPPSQVVVKKRVAGATALVGSAAIPNTAGQALGWYTLRLLVDTAGRFFVWYFPKGGAPGSPIIAGTDSALATGGTLASGKIGLYDEQSAAGAATRSFDNFAAWVPTTDAVLHPNQSAELRWDGHVREDAAGEAYGPVSHVIGDLPRLPPSGMEERPVELFLKASRGDFDQLPDSGNDDLSAQVSYKPSWLFVPGA